MWQNLQSVSHLVKFIEEQEWLCLNESYTRLCHFVEMISLPVQSNDDREHIGSSLKCSNLRQIIAT